MIQNPICTPGSFRLALWQATSLPREAYKQKFICINSTGKQNPLLPTAPIGTKSPRGVRKLRKRYLLCAEIPACEDETFGEPSVRQSPESLRWNLRAESNGTLAHFFLQSFFFCAKKKVDRSLFKRDFRENPSINKNLSLRFFDKNRQSHEIGGFKAFM